jgi:hypothetical protein
VSISWLEVSERQVEFSAPQIPFPAKKHNRGLKPQGSESPRTRELPEP